MSSISHKYTINGNSFVLEQNNDPFVPYSPNPVPEEPEVPTPPAVDPETETEEEPAVDPEPETEEDPAPEDNGGEEA